MHTSYIHAYLSCAQEVYAALSKTLADIENIFTELGEDSQLASHPMDDIKQAWVQLQALCKQYSELIDSFEKSLGGMEVQRSRAIGQELKKVILIGWLKWLIRWLSGSVNFALAYSSLCLILWQVLG